MIKCTGLTKNYKTVKALKGISFEITGKGCFGFLGGNGSGKSTTMRILAGLANPTSGKVYMDGKDVSEKSVQIASVVGYLPQHPSFYEYMTGEEWLMFVGGLFNIDVKESKLRTEQFLKKCGIWDARKRRIGGYSGGMKQRLGLAQALMNHPKILLLDEPVSALDPIGRHEVLNIIEDMKKDFTIFMSTHILEDVEKIADHILILDQGELVLQSTMDDIMEKYANEFIIFKTMDSHEGLKDKLEKQGWIKQVDYNNHSYRIHAKDINEAKLKLPGYLYQNGIIITDYKVDSLSLEEIFMKVVG